MIATIAALTLRQLLGKRRTIVLSLFAVLPVGLALLFAFRGDRDAAEWTASRLLAQIVVGTLLPLAALVFGTAALGSEIEDGTAVYLLSKPIPRWRILAAKLLVAWAVTSAFVIVSAVVASLVALQGASESGRILAGFSVAIAAGAFVYSCIFVLLSVVTSRAFITGLIYVFVWESVVTRLFTGTRVFSVRQYTLGVADLAAGVSERVFKSQLDGTAAVVLMAAVSLVAAVLAVRRLQSFETGEAG